MTRIIIALSILMALVTSSCSDKRDLLDTVPASSVAVIKLDCKKILAQAGVTITDDGGVSMSAELDSNMDADFRALLRTLARLDNEKVIDLADMVFALRRDGSAFFTFQVDDFKKFRNSTEEAVRWEGDADGFHTGKFDKGNARLLFLANDSQVWATGIVTDASKRLKEMLEDAKKLPVGKLDVIARGLREDNMINIASGEGFLEAAMAAKSTVTEPENINDKVWTVASVSEGADNSLCAEWRSITTEGKSIKRPGLTDINPAMIAYVPGDFNITLAAGITEGFDWKPAEQLALLLGGFQGAAFMSVVSPYLQSIDGTVLFAAKPANDEALESFDPSCWDFIALVHMPQSKINALISMIRTMAFTGGVSPQSDPVTGVMTLGQYGRTLYIGNIDGCFGIATIPFDNSRNNSLAPTFVNKDFAMNITVGPLTAYGISAPAGTELVMSSSVDNGQGHAKLKFTDTDTPFLSFLLSLLL